MSTMASQITILTIVYSTVYFGAYQRKYQSFASLAFVRGSHRWPVNSPYKGPVTQKMFPLDDVIMERLTSYTYIFFLYVSIDLVHLSTPICIPIVQPVKTNKHGYKEKPFKCRNRDSDNRKPVSNCMLGHTVQLYISSKVKIHKLYLSCNPYRMIHSSRRPIQSTFKFVSDTVVVM